jgi:hypothetical protein
MEETVTFTAIDLLCAFASGVLISPLLVLGLEELLRRRKRRLETDPTTPFKLRPR